MKIKLEPEKTTLRISKNELKVLLLDQKLFDSIILPGGKQVKINVSVGDTELYLFNENQFLIELPKHLIDDYKPSKTGLSFYFQIDNQKIHQLIFEVDIRKRPLKS